MSLDTVGGGKVWTPSGIARPGQPPPVSFEKEKAVLSCLILGALVTCSLYFLAILLFGSFPLETPDIVDGINEHHLDHQPVDVFSNLLAAIVVLTLLNVIVRENNATYEKIGIGVVLGVVGAALAIAFMGVNPVKSEDPKTILETWAQEAYGYTIVEILPTDHANEPHSVMDIGEEKFVVQDLETGEEKTVHYYEKNGNLYLATSDEDFLKQVRAVLVKTDTNDSSS